MSWWTLFDAMVIVVSLSVVFIRVVGVMNGCIIGNPAVASHHAGIMVVVVVAAAIVVIIVADSDVGVGTGPNFHSWPQRKQWWHHLVNVWLDMGGILVDVSLERAGLLKGWVFKDLGSPTMQGGTEWRKKKTKITSLI